MDLWSLQLPNMLRANKCMRASKYQQTEGGNAHKMEELFDDSNL